MARVFRRELLTEENVAKMRAAAHTGDFSAFAVSVDCPTHRAGNLVVKAGPAAMGVELVLGMVQRRVAAPADIGPAPF